MKRILLVGCLLGAAFTGVASAALLPIHPALAATTAPSLSGELLSIPGGSAVQCTSTQGNFTFNATGTASGPYSGTFTESGSGSYVGILGTVTAFTANFSIYSPSGRLLVTGSKTLATPNGSEACVDNLGNANFSGISTNYQATIYSPMGIYTDSGTSSLVISLDSTNTVIIFAEDFTSSQNSTTRVGVGGFAFGATPATSSTHWVQTTTYLGFTCATAVYSSRGHLYENNTTTPVFPGDLTVPGSSVELDTPSEIKLQCTFQTSEHPSSNQLMTGTGNCVDVHGDLAGSYRQTENTAGLITLTCFFIPQPLM